MTKDDKITALTLKWYELVNRDHHKDKDCHFYINKVWSYGNAPFYRVEHFGYIGDDISEVFTTYEMAEKHLLNRLKEMIKEEESRELL